MGGHANAQHNFSISILGLKQVISTAQRRSMRHMNRNRWLIHATKGKIDLPFAPPDA